MRASRWWNGEGRAMTMSEGDLAVAQIRFVRMQQIESLPAPLAMTGAIGWLRANLISTPFNMVMTYVVALLLIWIVPDTLRFLIFDAVWSGDDRVACLATPGREAGAC